MLVARVECPYQMTVLHFGIKRESDRNLELALCIICCLFIWWNFVGWLRSAGTLDS